MEHTIANIKKLLVLSIFLISITCLAQNKTTFKTMLLGKWKCVKHDYKGYQKFALKQAEQIRSSVLCIEKNTFHYSKASFIENCTFFDWQIKKYDITESLDYSIEYRYSKAELAKFSKIIPIDKKGELGCYNECSTFFMKQDTLITICGGYTFYWSKIKSK